MIILVVRHLKCSMRFRNKLKTHRKVTHLNDVGEMYQRLTPDSTQNTELAAVSSANPEMTYRTATLLCLMEIQWSVITGALCDSTISYANVVPLLSFDSASTLAVG